MGAEREILVEQVAERAPRTRPFRRLSPSWASGLSMPRLKRGRRYGG